MYLLFIRTLLLISIALYQFHSMLINYTASATSFLFWWFLLIFLFILFLKTRLLRFGIMKFYLVILMLELVPLMPKWFNLIQFLIKVFLYRLFFLFKFMYRLLQLINKPCFFFEIFNRFVFGILISCLGIDYLKLGF